MLAKMMRYKVHVMDLKPRRAFPLPTDEEIFIQLGDTFFGYSWREHRVGKYFDLWFTNPKHDDPDNFVTFGRINAIGCAPGKGTIYDTRFGTFAVEEIHETGKRESKGKRICEGSKGIDLATVPRTHRRRRDRAR